MKKHAALLAGLSLSAALMLGMPAMALAQESTDEGATVEESAELTLDDGGVTIYRLYQIDNNEHLYTSDYNEVVTLFQQYGWGYEGEAWTAPSTGTPVYRLYSPSWNQHLYTTDLNEINVLTTLYGWQYDNDGNPLFYSDGSVNIYRLYSDELHLLTADFNEYNVLGLSGWDQEGVALTCMSLPTTSVAKTRWYPESMTDGFIAGDGGNMYYTVNGQIQTNTMIRGYRTRGVEAIYWVGADGALVKNRFIQPSECGYLCYAQSDGALITNCYFEMNGQWWHADANGALTESSAAYERADFIAKACGNDLYSCFNWCASVAYDSSLGSRDFYYTDPEGWVEDEAWRFYNAGGDCYSYAAGFCLLARVLGYDANVRCGYVSAAAGGLISHGWVEININGETLVYDPEGAYEHPDYDWYARTYDNCPSPYTF